jgi:digeranylgeranylglycerophospholipid reductase
MKKYDLIVVGSGAAGSIAAYFGAKYGFDVCLLDGKSKENIGDKVCGDGIGSEIFDFLKIPHPKPEEYLNAIRGAKLYPPDTNYPIHIKDKNQAGYVIDRLAFGQRLLNDAIDSGAKLVDKTHAISPILKEDKVTGVKIRSKTIEETELFADVVIDASGFHTQLRKQIEYPFIKKKIDSNDFIVCYREIIRLKNPVVQNLDYISIYLDNERAPGGYVWYFPRNEHEVNIGLGILDKFKHQLIDIYQQKVLKPLIGNEPYQKITGGSGLVSICKPLWTGVANGIMFAGDAAFQVNPITGGGLISSMQAGFYTIQAYKKATEFEKFDALALWEYNLLYQKTIGAEFAPLDLLRIALQKIPNENIDFTFKKSLISGEEITGITGTGELKVHLVPLLGKIIRGISKPNFLMDLNFIRTKMQEMKQLYSRYPDSPIYLENWIKEVKLLYKEVQQRFR